MCGGYPLGAENDSRAPYNEKEPNKKLVKVFVSVTYSKSLEVEVKENYTDADLKEAVQEAGVLPNDILQDEHKRLRKHIKQHENDFDMAFKKMLINKRDRCTPWHEDELEVMEDF